MRLTLGLTLVFALYSQIACALSESQYAYVSADAGVLIPANNTQGAQLEYGGSFGIKLNPDWSVGAFGHFTSQNITVINATTSTTNMIYGLETVWYFNHFEAFPYLNLGLKTGIYSTTLTSTDSSTGVVSTQVTNTSGYIIGPRFGCEYTYESGLAIGGEFNVLYNFYDGSTPTELLLTVRVWF